MASPTPADVAALVQDAVNTPMDTRSVSDSSREADGVVYDAIDIKYWYCDMHPSHRECLRRYETLTHSHRAS